MELLSCSWDCGMVLGVFFTVSFNPTYVLIRPTETEI